MVALVAREVSETAVTRTLTGFLVAYRVSRTDIVTLARYNNSRKQLYFIVFMSLYEKMNCTFAFGKIVEAVGALVTEFPTEVLFARTLSAGVFTLSSSGAVQVAFAGFAIRISVIAFTAFVTVRRSVRLFTFALAEPFGTVPRQIE